MRLAERIIYYGNENHIRRSNYMKEGFGTGKVTKLYLSFLKLFMGFPHPKIIREKAKDVVRPIFEITNNFNETPNSIFWNFIVVFEMLLSQLITKNIKI